MNLTPTIKKVFFTLVMGIFLIYAIGGAAIASATISDHQALVPGIVNVMVSLGMTWLMVFGIPCIVLVSYYVYDALYTFMTELAESAATALREFKEQKGKGVPTEDFDRLALNEHETQRAHSSTDEKLLKEMNQ